jgi:hypothetical protein
MSVTSVSHLRSSGADRGPSAPTFLLRAPNRPPAVDSLIETLRPPKVTSSALLLGGGLAAVVLAVGFGAYVVVADAPKLSAPAAHVVSPAVRVPDEPASIARAAAIPDGAPPPIEAPAKKSVSAYPDQGPDAPRLVQTQRVDADPSVWATVRRFSPLPADEVPVVDAPPAQLPSAARVMTQSPRATHKPHHKPARAQAHQRNRARTHAHVHPAQMQAAGAPPDVGGTQMTTAELNRDGSKDPLVSAFSAVLGPR